ncbi:hypothetical protein KQI42_06230 [Tissierella sp. MSJ-40]|uniref:Uncharacterized protein n=1 Tax=Tissierella simiarum TaxID=2841534 RepID=A0ABS6E3V9_9FIRM|nr:hypothetical protein [Tissierella simiarum]MBU5437595.1 hypothetical protein [Tissierella simiarum]
MSRMFKVTEKLILLISLVSLVLLLFIQFINYDDNTSINTSYTSKFLPPSQDMERAVVILKLKDSEFKDTKVLLNGDPIDSFEKNDEISLEVYENDIIEIDGTKYQENIVVTVVGISSNLEYPNLDSEISTFQSIEILGRVKLK